MCESGGTLQLHPACAVRRRARRAPSRRRRACVPPSSSWRASRGTCARRAVASAVVQLHGLAVHRADPQQVETLIAAFGRDAARALGQRRREADALEPIEIDLLKHVESEAWVAHGAQRADADRRQTDCRNEAMQDAPGAAPDSNDFGGAGLEGRRGATRGSGGCRHGGRSRVRHGLGHEALLAGRWKGEARGASGSRPTACRRGPESARSAARRQRGRRPHRVSRHSSGRRIRAALQTSRPPAHRKQGHSALV